MLRLSSLILPITFSLFCNFILAQSQTQTQKSNNETVDATVMANQLNSLSGNPGTGSDITALDRSGDLNVSIPIVTVKSRTMAYPIQLNYAPGIKVSQQSGPVGLGWNINFGSIVRDYGAFEPDYSATTGEVSMDDPDNSIAPGHLTLAELSFQADPLDNGKGGLQYDALSGQDMVPDNYHVSLPGISANTFWNNGANGNPHDFVLKEQVPWRLDYSTKLFEFNQEFSRINEYNLTLPSSDFLDPSSSYAAAIGILPYVKQRFFKKFVVDPIAGSNIFTPTESDRKIRYEDFGEFTITTENGTLYVFGRALRGQKYMFAEDPYWSAIPNPSMSDLGQASKGEWWKMDYLAEWLLTEIRSPDYLDQNGNNVADDGDTGDWIRIEYTDPLQNEWQLLGAGGGYNMAVPKHREWMSLTQTDKASSLMRERAYVTKIVTPVMTVDFEISKRFDVDHDYYDKAANYIGQDNYVYENLRFGSASSDITAFDVKYPVEVMKYDRVIVSERLISDEIYARNNVLNTIILNYADKGSPEELAVSDYLIRDNNNVDVSGYSPSSPDILFNIQNYAQNTGRGKTTLLGIDFFPEDDADKIIYTGNPLLPTPYIAPDRRSYKFEYGFNPSYTEYHKWDIVNRRFFPIVRQSGHITSTNDFDRFSDGLKFIYEDEFGGVNTGEDMLDYQSFLPYKALTHKYNFSSDAARQDYTINGNAPGLTPQVTSDSPYPGCCYAGTDEMGYYAQLSVEDFHRTAWSMTKVTLPEGGSISFEYENDIFDYSGDRSNWNIKDNELPNIKEFNHVAKQRCLRQAAINEGNAGIPANLDIPLKTLTHSYSMPMNAESGGLRLKKKILDDGLNTPVEINYNYGTGHYTAVPAEYWANYISGFSSFLRKEMYAHKLERLDYLHLFPLKYASWTTDYENVMSTLLENTRLDNTVNGIHYYESIEEVYSDQSKIIKYYQTPYGSGIPFDVQHFISAKIGVGSLNRVSVIGQAIEIRREPRLIKMEYVDGGGTAYQSTIQSFQFTNAKSNSLGSASHVIFPGNSYVTYAVMTQKNFINPDNYIISEFTFGVPGVQIGGGLMQTELWTNVGGTGNEPDVYVSLDNLPFTNGDLTSYAVNIPRQQSYQSRLTASSSEYKDVVTNTIYTYEATYGLPKTTTQFNSTRSISGVTAPEHFITSQEYAFENYSDPIFINKNMLVQKTAVKTYIDTEVDANLLTAAVSKWKLNGNNGTPFLEAGYVYNGAIDPVTGKINSYVPFNYTGINDPKWEKRSNSAEYNRYGQPVINRNIDTYSRHVYGYNSSIPKANISYAHYLTNGQWFDATYTGFEDLNNDKGEYAIGSAPEDEYWYDQNLTSPLVPFIEHIQREYVDIPNYIGDGSDLPCGISTEIHGTSPPYYNYDENFVDNSFSVGDEVVIYPNVDACAGISFYDLGYQTLPPFQATIVSLEQHTHGVLLELCSVAVGDLGIEYLNSDLRVCFDPPLPRGYISGTIIEKMPVDYRISKVTTNRFRTGEYSYLLERKLLDTDPSQKSPIRPVEINYLTNSSSSFDYKGSIWVTKGIPRIKEGGPKRNSSDYSNGADKTNDQSLTAIIAQSSPNQIKSALLAASPISDDVMVAMRERNPGLSAQILKSVLNAQGELSDRILVSLIKNPTALKTSDLENLILAQNHKLSDRLLTSMMESSQNHSSSLIRDAMMKHGAVSDDLLEVMLKEMPKILETDAKQVLMSQPELTERTLNTMLDNPSLQAASKMDILENLSSYPSDEVLLKMLSTQPSLPTERTKKFLMDSPNRLSDDIIDAVKKQPESPFKQKEIDPIIAQQGGSGDIRLVYKLWNEDRTTLQDDGFIVLNNISNNWKHYEIDIPITKQSFVQYLDVYVENNLPPYSNSGNFPPQSDPVYLDDQLVIPAEGKYDYTSQSKFLSATYVTSTNNNTVRNTYDTWGRNVDAYDANEQLVGHSSYYTTGDISQKPSYQQNKILLDGDSYNETRTYLDGFGEAVQTQTNLPSRNSRMVFAQDLDDRGRPVKSYNVLGVQGKDFDDNIVNSYASKLNDLYGASSPYIETEYRDWPDASVSKTYHQKLSGDPVSFIQIVDDGNSAGEVSFLNIIYAPNQLLRATTFDENGIPTDLFTDKMGRTIATRTPIGDSYIFDATGEIIWNTSNFQYATTYFVYDRIGNLIKSIDPEDLETQYKYNSLGLVIEENHPDKGVTLYRYDNNGRLRFIQDARNASKNLVHIDGKEFTYQTYDKWGRIADMGKLFGISDFNNPVKINKSNYPYLFEGSAELHKRFEYDGSKAKNSINQVVKETVPFDHYFLSAGQVFNIVNTQASTLDEVTTDTPHGFVVGDLIKIEGTSSYNGMHIIAAVPSLIKFNIEVGGAGNGETGTVQKGVNFYTTEDSYEYTYTKNGEVKTTKFNMDGLAGDHKMTYTYNRGGLVTRAQYHNDDPQRGFIEFFEYDDLGRLVETSSGKNSNSLSIDTRNKYDAMGALKKKYLGYKPKVSNFEDQVLYSIDIRGRETARMAEKFRYCLAYDQKDNITKQLWSNDYFDNTGSTPPFIQNTYDYFYDPASRLVGADYSNFHSDNDPFDNYPNLAAQDLSDFVCNVLPQVSSEPDGAMHAIEHIEHVLAGMRDHMKPNNPKERARMNKMAICHYLEANLHEKTKRAYDITGQLNNVDALVSTDLIRETAEYAKIDIETTQNVVEELEKIRVNPEKNDQQKVHELKLKAQEMIKIHKPIKDGIYTKRNYEAALKDVITGLNATGRTHTEKLNTVAEKLFLVRQDVNGAKDMLNGINGTVNQINCQLRPLAAATSPICIPMGSLTNPQVVPSTKYDTENYFSLTGNFNQLNRYDNNSQVTTQGYTYTSNTNQLSLVNWDENGIPSTSNYMYDPNGNLTQDQRSGVLHIEYNPFNMAIGITKGINEDVAYRYNIANIRTVKEMPMGQSEYYIGNVVVNQSGTPKRYSITDGYVRPAGGQVVGTPGGGVTTGGKIVFEKMYLINDWLGTSRMVIDMNDGITSSRDHYPFGKLMPSRIYESDTEGKRYQFTGHEFDQETQYGYHGARYYNRELGKYLSVDLRQANFPNWSSYNYVLGNPINRIDRYGKASSPIYNTEGELLGTDNEGLTGEALVLNESDFAQGMDHAEAVANNLGLESLNDPTAQENLNTNYSNLSTRPDYDGFLTPAEGVAWALDHPNALDNPTPNNTLFLNAAQLDFGNLETSAFSSLNTNTPVNLLNATNFLRAENNEVLAATVYALGRVRMQLVNRNARTVTIVNDAATDFDWNTGGTLFRNTLIHAERAYEGLNDTHGFRVRYYGTGTLNVPPPPFKPNYPPPGPKF